MPLLPYSVMEGLRGFRRASFAAFAATSAMSVALVLVTVVAVAGWQAHEVATWLRQRVAEVEVYLDDMDDASGEAVHVRVQLLPQVAASRYVSRQEAVALFRQEFGEGGEQFFNTPFLPASVRITVRPSHANADSLASLSAILSSWPGVDEVIYNQPLLVRVQDNLRLITGIGVALGLLVLLASVFLVANTVRLTVYARRLMIRTMKLVGATDGFIRRPFVVEGIVQGLIAGVLATALLAAGFVAVSGVLPELTRPTGTVFGIAAAGTIAGGVLLGWMGSALSVRRFIRKVALH